MTLKEVSMITLGVFKKGFLRKNMGVTKRDQKEM